MLTRFVAYAMTRRLKMGRHDTKLVELRISAVYGVIQSIVNYPNRYPCVIQPKNTSTTWVNVHEASDGA